MSIKLARQIRIIPRIDCIPRLLTKINKDQVIFFQFVKLQMININNDTLDIQNRQSITILFE